MRSVAVNVLLRAERVASGTVGWCSKRCSEYWSSRGSGVLKRRNGLGNGWVVLGRFSVRMSIRLFWASLMRWDTCCDPGADQNPTTTNAPPPSLSPSYRERGRADQSLLWFEKLWHPLYFKGERLRCLSILWAFLKVEGVRAAGKLDPGIMMNEIVWQRQIISGSLDMQ